MNLGPNFFVVRADSNLRNVSDLRGKKVAIGLKTGGMMPHANAVLKAIGLGLNDVQRVYVDFAEGARMLISGEVDAQYQRPIPNRVMTELSKQCEVRVLRYDKTQIEAALRAIPYDRLTLMNKGSIRGLDEDIPQLGVLNLLVAHARTDERTVQLVAQAVITHAIALGALVPLFDGLPALLDMIRCERFVSLEFDDVRLHPGAARAYADAGFL
jgi:TRAP transporter TAXI family solute receptor